MWQVKYPKLKAVDVGIILRTCFRKQVAEFNPLDGYESTLDA